MSQAMRSVLSSDRDLVLCGEAGLGGLLKVELLEAVECRGESESWGRQVGGGGDRESHLTSSQHVEQSRRNMDLFNIVIIHIFERL